MIAMVTLAGAGMPARADTTVVEKGPPWGQDLCYMADAGVAHSKIIKTESCAHSNAAAAGVILPKKPRGHDCGGMYGACAAADAYWVEPTTTFSTTGAGTVRVLPAFNGAVTFSAGTRNADSTYAVGGSSGEMEFTVPGARVVWITMYGTGIVSKIRFEFTPA